MARNYLMAKTAAHCHGNGAYHRRSVIPGFFSLKRNFQPLKRNF